MELIRANSSTQKVYHLVNGLTNCLIKGNLPFSIVKTNKKEIEKLLEEGRRSEALGFLNIARQASENGRVESHIKAFENCLEDMGLSLSDLTNRDELDKLLSKGHEAEISFCVNDAIDEVERVHRSGEDAYEWIRRYVKLLPKNLSSFEKNSITIRLGMELLTD
jgi:hypothetical protein